MAEDLIDESNPYAGAELLARAAERAVLSGKMVPGAVDDCVKLFKHSVIVDSLTRTVTLNGKDLTAGLDEEIAKRDHWRPQGENKKQSQIADLKAKAEAGNLTSFSQLKRSYRLPSFRVGKRTLERSPVASRSNRKALKSARPLPLAILLLTTRRKATHAAQSTFAVMVRKPVLI
jgi:hypothetical protein